MGYFYFSYRNQYVKKIIEEAKQKKEEKLAERGRQRNEERKIEDKEREKKSKEEEGKEDVGVTLQGLQGSESKIINSN